MNNNNTAYGGRYPAIVKTYDPVTRTCRIDIPGITTGADSLLLAEIEFPIGDKSRNGVWQTEIEILPEDTVWVAFINGDSRYPIITGYRNPQVGNSVDVRRWHHKNIDLNATLDLTGEGTNIILTASTKVTIVAPTVEINNATTVTINGTTTNLNATTLNATTTTITATATTANITATDINLTGTTNIIGDINI
ncbi:MAG: hypothetical protein WC856_02420 [Methylococcaceae bacterium]|jgi:hypothetical protein